MRHSLLAITCSAVLLFAWGCNEDEFPIFYPGDSSKYIDSDSDSTSVTVPKNSTVPDYSLLTSSNHPRVIFTDEDFEAAKALYAAGTNSIFNELHDRLIINATSFVGAADLERVLTGKRLLTVSRNAEERILTCAYAYKMTGDTQYLDQAEHDIQTVCKFSDWNAKNHFLDVGEMAAGVGLGYDWLYNDLSSETKSLARTALNDFAFTQAINGVWNLDFYAATSNWNQVCNGGLVCAALAVYEDNQSTAQTIIDKALESNVACMEDGYSPDGNYPEGYSYWCYGTLYEALMLTAMETATGSDNGLSSSDGFSKTGKYMIYMEGPSGNCFNYSDCAPTSTPCLAQWYFAWKFGDLSVLFIEKDRINNYKNSDESRLLALVAYYASKVDVASVAAPTDRIFYGQGVTPVILCHDTWTMGTDDKFLGIKGGMAYTSHGHQDAGSFVFEAEGLRWAADLGLQSYATLEDYLNLWDMNDNSDRWTVFRLNNFNHNTITVNNAYHKVAKNSTFTGTINSNGQLGGTIDISGPLGDQLSSCVRTIYMEGDDLVIQDKYTALTSKDANIRWTMVTKAEPTIEYGAITLKQSGKTRYLSYTSSTGHRISWATWSAESENWWDATNTGYYECGYTFTLSAGESATITVKLTLTDPLG